MPRISVIVPARDSAHTLPRTLAALRSQRLEGGFEVLVVDDGSRDSTRAIAEAAGAPVRCLTIDRAGPAAARNRGVAESGAPLLAFTDADCVPAPGWLVAGTSALSHADLVQGRVLPDPATPQGPFDRTVWVTTETGLYETANLFVSRDTFDRAGGFEDWLSPRFGKAMAEDVWFAWRARRAGARTAFCDEALVHHAVFGRGVLDYVGERRRLEHFPELVRKIPELRETLAYRRVFLSQRSAALDLALAGVAAALVRRSPLALAAALPYAAIAARRARPHGSAAPAALAGALAADLVGFAALAFGSARARSLLL